MKTKKGLHLGWEQFCNRIFLKSRVKVDTFLLPIPMVAAVFTYSAKIDLKSAKNVVFCILCMPIGGAAAPRSLPGYVTGHNYSFILSLYQFF